MENQSNRNPLDYVNQWQKEGDVPIPKEYADVIHYEIIVFHPKKDFSFECENYIRQEDGTFKFIHCLLDSSVRDNHGTVTLTRFTYWPYIILNAEFMCEQLVTNKLFNHEEEG